MPYAMLAQRASQSGELLWVLRPKHHEPYLHRVFVLKTISSDTSTEFFRPRDGKRLHLRPIWTVSCMHSGVMTSQYSNRSQQKSLQDPAIRSEPAVFTYISGRVVYVHGEISRSSLSQKDARKLFLETLLPRSRELKKNELSIVCIVMITS